MFVSICLLWLSLTHLRPSQADTRLKQNHHHHPLLLHLPNGHCSYHRKTQETLLARPHHLSRPRNRCRVRLLVCVFHHPPFTELKHTDQKRALGMVFTSRAVSKKLFMIFFLEEGSDPNRPQSRNMRSSTTSSSKPRRLSNRDCTLFST